MPHQIDDIDARILTLLQERGRMKRSHIAEEVGMSVPATSERINKLEDRGLIEGYHAVVNERELGYDILSFIRVTVDGSEHYDHFVQEATALSEVQEVHSITGEGSHILKVRVPDTSGLERLLSRIQSWPGVHGTSTSIALTTFKESRVVEALSHSKRVTT